MVCFLPKYVHLGYEKNSLVFYGHLLVDGQEVDVGILHWQQEDQGVAVVTNARRATAAVHESAGKEVHSLRGLARHWGSLR